MVRMINFGHTPQHSRIVAVFTVNNRKKHRAVSKRVLICFLDRVMGVRKVKVRI